MPGLIFKCNFSILSFDLEVETINIQCTYWKECSNSCSFFFFFFFFCCFSVCFFPVILFLIYSSGKIYPFLYFHGNVYLHLLYVGFLWVSLGVLVQ
jgi:hypothetical protein